MRGKTVMVTGATDGIGKVAARVLAERGARVIVVGRNRRKLERSIQELKKGAQESEVEPMQADFESLGAVRELARQFIDTQQRLDVLVNNAGAFFLRRGETEDGLERTFTVNHLAHFLLTNLLLDRLQASAPARVVNVSSNAHVGARLDFDDLQNNNGYGGIKAYGQSKLANIYFTYELARRLEGMGITANVLHPGFVATNLGANNLPYLGSQIKRLVNLTAKDAERGAQTIIFLAASPEVEGVTGKYFVDRKPVGSSPVSYDVEAAGRLWQVSAQLTGLPFE